MNSDLHMADSVLARIVQIIQEGMILGVDVTDLMRQIKMRQSTLDPTSLVLTPEYVASVSLMHDRLEDFARERSKQNPEVPA